jgi:phosphoglycolate phosphatase-like HAD superfamily hydrolase
MSIQKPPRVDVHVLRNFTDLTPDHDTLFDVGLVLFDAENVVTPYKGDKIWPECREVIGRLHDAGINTCMLTNMKEGERARSIARQLGTEVFHQGMITYEGELRVEMPSKSDPYMFRKAVERVGHRDHGPATIMADDQLKNLEGARASGKVDRFLWTVPRGRSHLGVLIGRALEIPVGVGMIATQNVKKMKNGSYGEW